MGINFFFHFAFFSSLFLNDFSHNCLEAVKQKMPFERDKDQLDNRFFFLFNQCDLIRLHFEVELNLALNLKIGVID